MKKLKLLLSLVLLACINFKGYGTLHTIPMGAYITYQFNGNPNEYVIKLSLYRDCFGIPFPNQDTVCISSVSCGYNFNAVLSLQPGSGIQVDPCNMPVGTTTCQGGAILGVEKYEYLAQVTFPFACNDWRIDYSFMLWVGGLGMGDTYANVHSLLNNLDYPQNSSPSINNNPCFVGCVQLTNCFNFNVTDTNNNSFYFEKILMDTISGFYCPANITGQIAGIYDSSFYDAYNIDSLTGVFCVYYPSQTVNFYSFSITENLAGNNRPYVNTFFTYYIIVNCNTSVNEISNGNLFSLSPNPATDQITIQLNQLPKTNYQLTITDLLGKEILKLKINLQFSIFNIQSLSSGIYFLEINDGKNSYRKKFIKENLK